MVTHRAITFDLSKLNTLFLKGRNESTGVFEAFDVSPFLKEFFTEKMDDRHARLLSEDCPRFRARRPHKSSFHPGTNIPIISLGGSKLESIKGSVCFSSPFTSAKVSPSRFPFFLRLHLLSPFRVFKSAHPETIFSYHPLRHDHRYLTPLNFHAAPDRRSTGGEISKLTIRNL